MHKKIEKINDPRLVNYTKRTRSGKTQTFYTGNDERDWDRYRAEGGNNQHGVKMHDKPDTIYITPPEKHYYAELIDGEWWWLNGCAQCNGEPRRSVSYIECIKHDVCRSCGCTSNSLSESAWGGLKGWICSPCEKTRREKDKADALAAMPSDEDFRAYDYHFLDEITCPYCDYQFSDSWEYNSDDDEPHECERCDNTFTVTANHSVQYDCSRTEK